MQLNVYSIRDAKAEYFATPFFQATHGLAERQFTDLVNNEKSQVYKYPQDFDLYHLGTYDDSTGKIFPLDTPVHQLKAIQVLKSQDQPTV